MVDIRSEVDRMSSAIYIVYSVFLDDIQCRIPLDEAKCIQQIIKILSNDPAFDIYQIFIQNADKYLDGELGRIFVIKFLATEKIAKKCIYYQLHLRQKKEFGCVRNNSLELIKLKNQIRFCEDVIIIRENNYCVEKIWLPYDIWGDNKKYIEIL